MLIPCRSWVFSRFRLQEGLAQVAVDRGVDIRFGSVIEFIDQDGPAVVLEGGAELAADLIIGADGKSRLINQPPSTHILQDSPGQELGRW